MNDKNKEIFELAKPYLQKGKMKDFIAHTENVVRAMEMLIEGKDVKEDILIPAAILHDVGFSKVALELQTNADLDKKREAQRQHLILAREIIEEILTKVGYDKKDIEFIADIVEAHKFQDPKELEKQLLIDADNLSDTFKEQFYQDAKTIGCTPAQNFQYRNHKYYTREAKDIAAKNMSELKKELDLA